MLIFFNRHYTGKSTNLHLLRSLHIVFAKTTPEDFKKLVVNQPIKFLCTKTGHKESLFRFDAPTQTLILNEFLGPYLNDEIVAREYADICQSAVYLYFKKRYQEAAANDA